MRGSDLLRIVDQMHHEKNINRDIIFEGIEAALQLAMEKRYGEEEAVSITIDRESGDIDAKKGEEVIEPAELGRIAAQSAKQVMIQKIREAECNSVFNEYAAMKGDLVHGTVQRHEGGSAIVSVGKAEALLPRGEQIPGETHHTGERIKAVILDVRKAGHRVKIILSRTHPEFVRRLFENEIPEIADRTIEVRALSREAGYRSKIAVSSIDLKVDCVGACVGVRGSRIKNVVDELGGERIDIVRWNDSLQVMIPNALQPAQIEEVFLYPRLGRAIVMVKEDQLSLAIGRRGQNVRLASKLIGWDIEIMTMDELNEGIEKAEYWFSQIPGVTDEQVEAFIEEGFLSFDDLTFLENAELAELGAMTEEQAESVIQFAEDAAERVEEMQAEEEARLAEKAAQEAENEPMDAATAAAVNLLGGDADGEEAEARPTMDTLFGPDNEQQPEPEADEVVESEGETEPETVEEQTESESDSEEVQEESKSDEAEEETQPVAADAPVEPDAAIVQEEQPDETDPQP